MCTVRRIRRVCVCVCVYVCFLRTVFCFCTCDMIWTEPFWSSYLCARRLQIIHKPKYGLLLFNRERARMWIIRVYCCDHFASNEKKNLCSHTELKCYERKIKTSASAREHNFKTVLCENLRALQLLRIQTFWTSTVCVCVPGVAHIKNIYIIHGQHINFLAGINRDTKFRNLIIIIVLYNIN